MISSWEKFNESNMSLTKEMVQEIIFYFGECCDHKSTDPIVIGFQNIYHDYHLGHIVMYETSYDEMMEYVSYLLNMANKDDNLKKELIDCYNKIRERLSEFPEVFEVEDNFLSLIDYGFKLSILIDDDDINNINYSIKLVNYENFSLDQFFKFSREMESIMKRFNKYNPSIDSFIYCRSYIEFRFDL